VEGTHREIQLANSLNWLDCQGKLIVQCINLFPQPDKLSARALVGKYHSIQETDVGPALELVASSQGTPLATVEVLSRSTWLTYTREHA